MARTLVDLADVLTAHQLANVMHEAAFRRLLHMPRLHDTARRNQGRRGSGVLARAIELNLSGSPGTRSELEDTFLSLLRSAGGAAPDVNTRLEVEDGHLEVDFFWPQLQLCVEVDGNGHERRRTRREDARRDALLRRAGYEIVRCTPNDMERCIADLVARLRA